MASYKELQDSIIAGQKDKAIELVDTLLQAGSSPNEVITEGLIKGMSIVGENWKAGQMFIPEVLMAADIVNEGMVKLRPLMIGDESLNIHTGKFLIGTVHGDIHNIGKNLVSVVLQSGGFEVIDIGVDIPVEKFVKAVKEYNPDILGLSALLTLTMPRMKEVIEAIQQNGLRDKVRIMVGGAPITQDFAEAVGADAYASDAISALERARKLMAGT